MSIHEDIMEFIREGDVDDHLNEIFEALQARRAIKGGQERAKNMPKIGSTVRLTAIRPRYLVGLTVTVKRVNQKSIVADIPNEGEYRTWAGRTKVRIPMTCIEVIA